MASMEQLQAERAQIIAEIQRRGGKAKAPGFAAKLAQIDQQISAMRNAPQAAAPEVPPSGAQAPDTFAAIDPEYTAPKPKDNLRFLGRKAIDAATSNLGQTELGQAFNPDVMARASQEDIAAQRAAVEEALFKNLTKNLESDKARDAEQLSQSLANRGIPVGSELYNQQMQQFNDRYDTITQNARNSASILGLQELQGLTGVQEEIIGNQYNQAAGVRDQQLQEISGLTDLDLASKDFALRKKQLQIQQQALNQPTGGGAPQEEDPFNNTPPPGL
jgi:hypothetical protein